MLKTTVDLAIAIANGFSVVIAIFIVLALAVELTPPAVRRARAAHQRAAARRRRQERRRRAHLVASDTRTARPFSLADELADLEKEIHHR